MKDLIGYLTQRIETDKAETVRLETEGRQDEANFVKVRANIYDVCRKVTNALLDRPDAGKEAVKTQLERFRTVWGAALEKARENGDAKGIVVEETKLEALEDVISHFPEE